MAVRRHLQPLINDVEPPRQHNLRNVFGADGLGAIVVMYMTVRTETFAKSMANYLSILDKPWTMFMSLSCAWWQLCGHKRHALVKERPPLYNERVTNLKNDGGPIDDEVITRFLRTTCQSTSGVFLTENRSGIRGVDLGTFL
jgi:hypothetical protein